MLMLMLMSSVQWLCLSSPYPVQPKRAKKEPKSGNDPCATEISIRLDLPLFGLFLSLLQFSLVTLPTWTGNPIQKSATTADGA